ncbi:hypothetical protein BTR14_22175 [Rhizobium rhizosphaerae]|uniref:Uncharacterized protein n=1 Tax=Xaviernesmea rhizosphaerae TaxID=1672749 RepID=A0ABX3P7D4_9HYPH|nr:glycosyltransferase [Xaviernesmea rhizosphaerae]OQP83619.1 hypothetical protein BTR14_22175 [Xaviernesmea rhizosphaerae]
MKIIHVCETIIGGTGSYLSEVIPHQVERYGAENVALLIPQTHMPFVEKSILDSGARIFTFARPRRLSGSIYLSFQYLRRLQSFKPDIIHAHSSIAGVIVRSLRMFTRAPIVFCPHGWSMDMKGSRAMLRMTEVAERVLGRLPDQIVVISAHEYQRALDIGIPTSRLTLIPNGIANIVPAVAPAPWDDDRIKVLYAGRFDYQKGVDVLMRAVEGLDDRLSVRLVGDAASGNRVLPAKLPACVTEVGWLDRKGVTAQMMSCDVLVVPSRWEGFGLVAIEAMRLAKPVIASAVGGLQEIIDQGRYGYLVQPEDVQELHDRLLELDREELRAMGEIGHNRYLSKYTADRMVRQLDDLYARMLLTSLPAAAGAGTDE